MAIKVNDFLSEISNKIKECVSEIESYSVDAPDLTVTAANSLQECEELINNLNRENVENSY